MKTKFPVEVPKLPAQPKPDRSKFTKQLEKFKLPKIIPEFPEVKRFIVWPV